MSYIEQKNSNDCGVAALAMLCDVTYDEALKAIPFDKRGFLGGITSRQIREGGLKLGHLTDSEMMRPVRRSKAWVDLPNPMIQDFWYLVPYNSLVKLSDTEHTQWHWVAWRKGKVYDPARGVFHPGKFGKMPVSYMQFVTIEVTQ